MEIALCFTKQPTNRRPPDLVIELSELSRGLLYCPITAM